VKNKNRDVRRKTVRSGKIQNRLIKAAALLCFSAGIAAMAPQDSQAAVRQAEVQMRSSYMVAIEAPAIDVHTKASESAAKQGQVRRGQTYEVLSSQDGGWVKIRTGGREGYIKTTGKATVVEKTCETVDQDARKRRQVVEYALQFLGGEYVYGGTDPNSGVDCSGFTRYVLSKAASIDLPHSSSGQARFGEVVSEEEMQPGDLLFYGAGGGINHVAMYIGDGRVVHASTEKTGIKTSPYDYREPVKIISLLS
jgi:cell wall-associated NlpC family hydrolase